MTHSWLGAVAVKSRSTRSGCRAGAGVGFGGADPFAAAQPCDAGGPHQPGDLITADVVAGPAGGFPQLAGPVDAVVVLPQSCTQRRTHDRVTAGPRDGRARLGRVVGARGHRHPC